MKEMANNHSHELPVQYGKYLIATHAKSPSAVSLNDQLFTWSVALRNKKFLWSMLTVVLLFAIQMTFISFYQAGIERRPGVTFEDPILNLFDAVKVDTLTFIAIYSAHIVALVAAFRRPELFFRLAVGYLLVYFFRIFSIYMLPLDPPPGTITLRDPLLYWFGHGQQITRDLFYSGHTSSTFMAFLTTNNKYAKSYIFIALLFVVFGVLGQKVHYSIDVYAAFFFAFTAYSIAKSAGRFLELKIKN